MDAALALFGSGAGDAAPCGRGRPFGPVTGGIDFTFPRGWFRKPGGLKKDEEAMEAMARKSPLNKTRTTGVLHARCPQSRMIKSISTQSQNQNTKKSKCDKIQTDQSDIVQGFAPEETQQTVTPQPDAGASRAKTISRS